MSAMLDGPFSWVDTEGTFINACVYKSIESSHDITCPPTWHLISTLPATYLLTGSYFSTTRSFLFNTDLFIHITPVPISHSGSSLSHL